MHSLLPEMIVTYRPLLCCSVFHDETYSSLRTIISNSMEPSVQDVRWELAGAVRLALTYDHKTPLSNLLAEGEGENILAKVIQHLDMACDEDYGEPLSFPSFSVMFPVLEVILNERVGVSGCDRALAILAAHTKLDWEGEAGEGHGKNLRKDMIDLTLTIIKTQGRVSKKPEQVGCFSVFGW